MDKHITLGPGIESVRIDTPDGVISVTYMPRIGTSTCVYKDPNHNTVGVVHLEPVVTAADLAD